jgi:hypothetical protein
MLSPVSEGDGDPDPPSEARRIRLDPIAGRKLLADIANPVLALAQRLNDQIDAIAHDQTRAWRAPGDQGIDQDIGRRFVVAERGRRLR